MLSGRLAFTGICGGSDVARPLRVSMLIGNLLKMHETSSRFRLPKTETGFDELERVAVQYSTCEAIANQVLDSFHYAIEVMKSSAVLKARRTDRTQVQV